MTLHQQIDEALASNQHGWCSREKAQTLASCVLAMGGGTVCEIGLFAGRSFFPMAMAVKHIGKGVAVGIDPFTVDAAVEGEQQDHADWWKNVPFHKMEHIFLEALAELELQGCTKIIKAKSEDVEPPAEIAVLHVDGQHREKALQDVARYSANVVMGGFVILDDLHWDGGKVEQSAEILLATGFVERRRLLGKEEGTIYSNDFGVFQKVRAA